jgi:YggT family protein
MLDQAIRFLLETVFLFFVFAALTRFFMQRLRAPVNNPIAQFSIAITDFLVRPLRRLIPGVKGYDWASLIAAWLGEFVLMLCLFAVGGLPLLAAPQAIGGIGLLALVKLVRLTIYLFMAALFIAVILSWVSAYHPFASFFRAFSDPLLKPLQRRLPPIGGVDISPVFVLVAMQLILMLPVTWLEEQAMIAVRRIALP